MALHRKQGTKLTALATEALRTIVGWFPDRQLRCCADGAYAATLMAADIPRLTSVSRLRRDAALYHLKPKPSGRRGRPRQRGARLGTPTQISKRAKRWNTVTIDQRGRPVTKLIHSCIVLWYAVSKIVGLEAARAWLAGSVEEAMGFLRPVSSKAETA